MTEPAPTARAGSRTRAIVFGMIGAVLGYVAMFTLVSWWNIGPRGDIGTAVVVVTVFCPLGALAGLLLGVKLAMRGQDPAAFLRNALVAGGVTLGAVAVIGGGVAAYMIATATPWLKPSMTLEFEVRLPAGAKAPAGAREVKLELQTDLNAMPGELLEVRNEADRAVLVGKVELMYRTRYRQVEVRIAGQGERVFPINLPAKPPAAAELGGWQKEKDGSEIRYRAR